MKFKYYFAIAGFAMAIFSCDEGTGNVGMSLTSSNDDINVIQEVCILRADGDCKLRWVFKQIGNAIRCYQSQIP